MKPRVMSLVLFTSMVGLLIAPEQVSFTTSAISLFAVAMGAGAAGALNMWYESDLDALMTRTCLRPIPTGKVQKNQALWFGVVLSSNIDNNALLYSKLSFIFIVSNYYRFLFFHLYYLA